MVLREGQVQIRDLKVFVVIVSVPIIFEGCTWQTANSPLTRRSSEVQLNAPRESTNLPRSASSATISIRKGSFLQKINHPSAADIVTAIKNFVQGFLAHPVSHEEETSHIRESLDAIEESIKLHPLWKDSDDKQIDEVREGLEKYALLKLHPTLFGNRMEDREKDEEISEKLAKLHWIKFEHLEIPAAVDNQAAMNLACEELRKMNSYKLPRDKLVTILNCCKIVYKMLSLGSSAPTSAGADDFLPLLIIVLIRANPPHLQSNIQ
jgi:Rab5 GDP/GTP exchange factor